MPEQQARVSIDAILQQAGWHVCSMEDANIHAGNAVLKSVALARLPLNNCFGFAEGLLYIDGEAAGVIKSKKEDTILSSAEGQFSSYARGLPPTSSSQIRIIAEVALNMNRETGLRQSLLRTAFNCAKGT